MSVTADKASAVGEWLARGRPVARAVLVAVEDSAPLAPGASLYVDEDGTVEGSLTGGCVESAVAQEALAVLAGAPPGVHVYGISDELAGTAGLTCGGTVRVFVHALDPHSSEAVAAAAAAVSTGQPAALATVLDGPSAGATLALLPGDEPATGGSRGGPALVPSEPPVAVGSLRGGSAPVPGESVVAVGSLRGGSALDRAVLRDAAGLLDQGVTTIRSYGAEGEALGTELRVFVRSFAAPPQLLLFGANDFSAALAPLAAELGWAVTISDPRAAFAGAPRFARAAGVHVGWPEAALAGRRLGPRDAVLVFSHDPRLDLPALRGALASEAGYVGALGSRRTTAERSERLRAAGVSEDQLARLHAPCGLDIGARTAEETALSVLAEIVAVRSGRSSLPLRDTSGPIQPR